MAEGVNVRFAGPLQQFIRQKTGDDGLYASASEYIRDLVRRDFERDDSLRQRHLRSELASGLAAPDSDFMPIQTEELLDEARKRRSRHGS